MTTTRKDVWTGLAALALVASTACGGSGDMAGGANPGGTVGAAATVKGTVQSFSGGLVVNGVAFRTSGATIRDDGGPPASLSSTTSRSS